MFEFISKFAEYLDFNQLNRLEKGDKTHIDRNIIKNIKISPLNIFNYVGTPFLYTDLPFFFIILRIIFKSSEDTFFQSAVFQSILHDPLLQKSFDFFKSKKTNSNNFENVYMKLFTATLSARFTNDRGLCILIYESLDLNMKFLFKATLIQNIILFIGKEKESQSQMSFEESILHIKTILNQCIITFEQSSNVEKFEFFLNNFNSFLYNVASEISFEMFKKVILDFDLEFLIEYYNKMVKNFLPAN